MAKQVSMSKLLGSIQLWKDRNNQDQEELNNDIELIKKGLEEEASE